MSEVATLSVTVRKLPIRSYEAAQIFALLRICLTSCVTISELGHQITCEYHFTILDMRCHFKKPTQLLSIFSTATICLLSYQGSKMIKT